ncbi:hypothetical protein ACIREE_40410 [Streptomyces sp. NPDC102467]|uniref:hypothetical protein n=1 Tax=Streptomyces sp. NPDC102467 TaxID=3366179 RepID=UPI00382E29A9
MSAQTVSVSAEDRALVEVGHAGPNLPMPVGIRAAFDAAERTLALLEPAVETG